MPRGTQTIRIIAIAQTRRICGFGILLQRERWPPSVRLVSRMLAMIRKRSFLNLRPGEGDIIYAVGAIIRPIICTYDCC